MSVEVRRPRTLRVRDSGIQIVAGAGGMGPNDAHRLPGLESPAEHCGGGIAGDEAHAALEPVIRSPGDVIAVDRYGSSTTLRQQRRMAQGRSHALQLESPPSAFRQRHCLASYSNGGRLRRLPDGPGRRRHRSSR